MSFGTSTINNLPTVNTYAVAHRHFTRTEQPKTKRGGTLLWDEFERPLGNKTLWHYRIEASRQGTDAGPDYYDMCLYNTTMARFFRPEADGSEMREYVTHGSSDSSAFMFSVLRIGYHSIREVTTDSKHVEIPIGYHLHDTHLYFTADDVVDISRSKHSTAHTSIATAEIKAWRKETKAHLKTLTMLWEMMVPEWRGAGTVADTTNSHRYARRVSAGYAFSTLVNKASLYRDIQNCDYEGTAAPTQEQVEAMQALYKACVQFVVCRKAWNDDTTDIVPANITKSFLRHLEEALDGGYARYTLPRRTERKPLPKFAEKLPKGWSL
jgi:hypothetical protein